MYDGIQPVEEFVWAGGSETWLLAREFLWGERFPEPLALITHGGQNGGVGGPGVPAGVSVYHYVHDALGSVVALLDAGDPNASPEPIPPKVVERYTYDPYGRTVVESDPGGTGFQPVNASSFGNPFAWTGQRYDAGVGLYHFLYRTFSPEFGRWFQRDPAGYVDSINLYNYCRLRPTIATDPLGLGTFQEPEQRLGENYCDFLERAIRAATEWLYDELNLWADQIDKPWKYKCPEYSEVDQGHQTKVRNHMRTIERLRATYGNACSGRDPGPINRLVDGVAKRWGSMPKEQPRIINDAGQVPYFLWDLSDPILRRNVIGAGGALIVVATAGGAIIALPVGAAVPSGATIIGYVGPTVTSGAAAAGVVIAVGATQPSADGSGAD